MLIGHCTGILKPDVSTVNRSSQRIHSYDGLTLKTSAFRIPVRWSIYIINSVDKTKFLCTAPQLTQHHSFFRNYPFSQ